MEFTLYLCRKGNMLKNLSGMLAFFNELKLYWDKIPEERKQELIEKLIKAASKVLEDSK
jgi:hypothetical protein